MSEARRVLAASGFGVVAFAHKTTAGWEAQLQAMIEAGMVLTGSARGVTTERLSEAAVQSVCDAKQALIGPLP